MDPERRRERRERLIEDRGQARELSTDHRRLYSLDDLPMPRAFFRGPRWRQHCGVASIPIAEVDPIAAPYHRPGRKLLIFSFEEEVRERVLEEIRPDVFAEWTDPRERYGLA